MLQDTVGIRSAITSVFNPPSLGDTPHIAIQNMRFQSEPDSKKLISSTQLEKWHFIVSTGLPDSLLYTEIFSALPISPDGDSEYQARG